MFQGDQVVVVVEIEVVVEIDDFDEGVGYEWFDVGDEFVYCFVVFGGEFWLFIVVQYYVGVEGE